MDYDIDTNPTEGFTTRWADRDVYVHKASLVHTVHQIAAGRRWAWEQGAQRELYFERVEGLKDDKHGNMVKVIEWAVEIEVWGNYELADGDLIHGWDMRRADVDTLDLAPNPEWIGKVQGDGTSGDMVTIVCANKPPILHIRRWWCCVLPDEAAFRSLREEIQTGEAWNASLNATRQEPQLSNSLRDEDQQILRHLVEHHNLNPSQALAVRQCLDEGVVISSMTGGAGTGKSETMVACIKAVMWQQGYFDPWIPNPKAPDSIHTGTKGGGGGATTDKPPRACILVTAPTNAQVDNLMLRVIQSAEQDLVFSEAVLKDNPMPWMRLRAARGWTPPGLQPYNQTTVQQTLANHPDCNGTLQCALNSCRVLFATAGMVATRRKLLLAGDPQTRFAFSFVDESSRRSIPVASMHEVAPPYLLPLPTPPYPPLPPPLTHPYPPLPPPYLPPLPPPPTFGSLRSTDGSLRSTDGSLRSTRGPAPAPPLNSMTPAVATDRLVCAPPFVCTAFPVAP